MKRAVHDYLARPVAAREESRRRALLLSIGALIVLSTSPVLGHHLTGGAETLLRGTDHIGEVCLVALHLLLAPVHELFHVLLTAGIAYALFDRARAWYRMRRVLASTNVATVADSDALRRAAADAHLDHTRLRIVNDVPNPAFTTGWLRPRVYVAKKLIERLSHAELTAVLAHERAHVSRRDPLRLSVLRFFARTLFWIPALARLADDVADEAEVAADDEAAQNQPLVLASAILSVAQWITPAARHETRVTGAVGLVCHDMLERRVRRLAGEDTQVRSHVTRRSLMGAAAVLALVWSSGVLMAHPLPADAAYATHQQHGQSGKNCMDHLGAAILHVFCPGLSVGRSHHDCPHFAAAATTTKT